MRGFLALLLAAFFSVAPVLADTPTVGVDVNLIVGRQKQSSSNSTALPTVPVPMFSANVPIKQFSIFAEGVPPIGPVSYGDGRGSTQGTKLNYMAIEGRWHVPGDRFTFGLGTALVNQATYYHSRFINASEQSSRVAGFRFSLRALLEQSLQGQTQLTTAFSPSMHGLQHTYLRLPIFACSPFKGCRGISEVDDSELASLVDLEASRVQRFGRFGLRYGVRYINYSAKFPNGFPADRERFVMPFVGMESAL